MSHVLSSVSDFNFLFFTILVGKQQQQTTNILVGNFNFYQTTNLLTCCGPILKHPLVCLLSHHRPLCQRSKFFLAIYHALRGLGIPSIGPWHIIGGAGTSATITPVVQWAPFSFVFVLGAGFPLESTNKGVLFFCFFLAATTQVAFVPPDCPDCSRLVSSSPKAGHNPTNCSLLSCICCSVAPRLCVFFFV